MALQPWRIGKIIRIDDHTPATKRFFIEVPEVSSFDFTPGQFITFDLPIHEKINKRVRSYSIASWPTESNVFELVIVYLEGGAGTHYLFNVVKVGSELTFRGSQGVLYLKKTICKGIFS
jgi:CDP-4-dehydro-6-deoxyglucose reductase